MGTEEKIADPVKSLGANVRELKSKVEKEIYNILTSTYQQTGITITDVRVTCQKPIYGNAIEARTFQVEITFDF